MVFDYISALPICSWILVFIKALPVIFLVSFSVSLFFKKWRQKVASKLWTKLSVLKVVYIFIAIIIGFALLILFVGLYSKILSFQCNIPQTDGTFKLEDIDANFALAFLGTVTGLVALFGGYLAILRSEELERQSDSAESQAKTAEQRLISERLKRVTEGLGKKDENGSPIIGVRLEALYSLEDSIRDNNYDYIRIMEMLADYVRTNSPAISNIGKINVKEPLRKDIQTSLTIIGWNQGLDRVKKERDIEYRLDLSDCDLHGAELPNKNLSRASFNNSYMDGINLFNTTLNNAQFNDSNLTLARLHNANLTHTLFYTTNLNYADLSRANLTGASIIDSNLTDVNLTNTNLRDASMIFSYAYTGDFSKCKNLTQEQLVVMYCGIGVKIPNNLTRPDHWPTDEMSQNNFIKKYEKWLETP